MEIDQPLKSADPPIIVEYIFNTSIQKVWKALTDLDEMKKWYFSNIESFKPEIGFTTSFKVLSEDREFTHNWEVTEVIPYQKIAYNWKYDEYPGDSLSIFELIESENQVKVRLTAKILHDFPDNVPEFTRQSCEQGWQYFIGKNLKEYLA